LASDKTNIEQRWSSFSRDESQILDWQAIFPRIGDGLMASLNKFK